MKHQTLIAVLLAAAGVLCVAYSGFTYSPTKYELGVVQVSADDAERINFPLWLGVALLAAGGGLLLNRRLRNK